MADENKYVYEEGQLEIVEGKKPKAAPDADKPVDTETKKVGNVEVHVHRK